MASEPQFNPYHKWLGIPPNQQPPHYYRLLALQLYEDDPEVIQSAADQRMAHVRTFQSGTHSEESQKLLNELAAARICLLKPERKSAYDADLKAKLAPPAEPAPAPGAAPQATDPPTVTLPQAPISPLPPAPSAMALPPGYSVMPVSWMGQMVPTAVPVLQSAAPAAIPVQPPGMLPPTEEESDGLPFEVTAARRYRYSRGSRKNDTLPLFLILLGVLLFASIVAAVMMKERSIQPRSVKPDSPRTRVPSASRPAATPPRTTPALSPGRKTSSPPGNLRPTPIRNQLSEPLAVPFPGAVRQLPSVIDNADPAGFTLSGSNWQTVSGGGRAFRGSLALHLPAEDGAAAEWTFDGLEPGKRYDIFVTWSADISGNSQAWYGIRDGALGSQFLVVDQSVPMHPDVSVEGHPFQKLATVRLTSGILTVRLESGDGSHLQADAVLLSRVADPQSDGEVENGRSEPRTPGF